MNLEFLIILNFFVGCVSDLAIGEGPIEVVGLTIKIQACQSQKESSPSSSSQGLKIVTSFYPIYSMVKAISGDLNDVRMIQSSSGIHDFEPSANDVAAIYDADVFVYHSPL